MKLSVDKQITYLKYQKGISFDEMSEESAKTVLQEHTYYYKVTCFRKNFSKDVQGKYLNVDFALLNDLAVIDMRLRYLLLHLTLDLEHALKTRLIESITTSYEDGYSIVEEFNEYEREKYENRVRNTSPGMHPAVYRDVQSMHMRKVRSTEYDYHLINTYNPKGQDMKPLPIWAFLEKISYGGLEKFIRFYVEHKKNNYKMFKAATDLLMYSKRIRDAAAHNRPILINIGNNHHAGTIKKRVSSDVERFIIQRSGYSKDKPEHAKLMKRMMNIKVHDLMCVFMLHHLYVASTAIRKTRQADIDALIVRASYRKHLYLSHPNMINVFDLFAKVLHSKKLSLAPNN